MVGEGCRVVPCAFHVEEGKKTEALHGDRDGLIVVDVGVSGVLERSL